MSKIINNTVVTDRKHGVLRFRVSAGNGDRVTFPVPFKTDRVDVHIASYYDGVAFITAGTTAQSVTDRYGFTLSKLAHPGNGNAAYWDTRISPVDVLAIGVLEDESDDENIIDDLVGVISSL